MGIYYCCDIYVGGIGDTLNYAQRLIPCNKGNSLRTQQLYNSPPPKLSYCPTPIIYKLIKENKIYIYLYCNTITCNTSSNNTKIIHIDTN